MWSRVARVAAAATFALIPTLVPPTSSPAVASGPTALSPTVRGQDVCPEPNDTFQAACYLGRDAEALGFISTPTDVDAYRIEVYDFSTDVHVEMPTMPAAYKIELANWNGDIIATSSPGGSGGEVIDTTVPIPGSYYIFVHSAAGGFSDAQPYEIFRALTYPGSSIPDVIDFADFRAGSTTLFSGENEYAKFSEGEGRYTIAMKVSGTPDSPSRAWNTSLGTTLTDFTLTVDARLSNSVDGGFQIFFRKATGDNSDDNTYSVIVDARDGQVLLTKKVNGEGIASDWVKASAVNTKGGVNRVVIRCFEDDIRVNVNGDDVFDVNDNSIRQGRIGLGAVAWGDPPVVNFDNIIITTPSEG
jgi:hypothetical protein